MKGKAEMGRFRSSALGSIALAVLSLTCSVSVQAAILLEEGGKSVHRPISEKTASNGIEMRRIRRVGIGGAMVGPLGLGGANIELNFSPEASFVGGFGGGPGFQAFTMQYKRVLGGRSLLPYFMAGYSRWYGTGQSAVGRSTTTPTLLGEKLLNDSERSQKNFAVNLIYPGLGLQFLQLSGPWAGSSIFFEAVMLLDIEDFIAAPTGTIGYLYYF